MITLDDIKACLEILGPPIEPEVKFYGTHLLNGMKQQTVFKIENKVFYPTDLKSGEIKFIDLDLPLNDKAQ